MCNKYIPIVLSKKKLLRARRRYTQDAMGHMEDIKAH